MKKIHSYFILFSLFVNLGFAQNSSLYLPGNTGYTQNVVPPDVYYVDVGDLDVSGDKITVEALVNRTVYSVNIVSKHCDPSDVNYLFRVGTFEITTVDPSTNNTNFYSLNGAPGFNFINGKTYHVAATYDGQYIRYYVNGCLTGQMAASGNLVQNNWHTLIGNRDCLLDEQFRGYIDEVRIWNVARTQQQIADNMLDLPNPTSQPGLLGYWKFDGNYTNQQGNANFNGTPVGNPQFQPIPYPYPSKLHATVTPSNPVCNGEANGVINVAASGYYSPYQYSLDGVNYYYSPVFQNLPAGNYTVYIRPKNNNNCIVTKTVSIVDPSVLNANLATTNVSCNGGNNGSASVSPSGGHGPSYNQLWLPQNSVATSVSNLTPGNYSVIVADTCKPAGPELVTNGTFENGAIGFTSDYIHCTTCNAGYIGFGEGKYVVSFNPALHHTSFGGTGHGGGGNFLIVNGESTPNTNVWCQTISVAPNTFYTFSTWVATLFSASPANLQFYVNNNPLGASFIAPAVTGVWSQYSATWFSGSNTSATICIKNLNTNSYGNDFGLDDISFKKCLSCIDTIPYTITEPTALQITTSQTDVSCNGGSDGTATANPSGGTPPYTYSWNTTPIQTTSTANNLAMGSYTVTVTDNNNCVHTASVNITEPPALSLVLDNITNPSCYGLSDGSISVLASGGTGSYTYSWNPNVSTTSSATNLPDGSYDITVTDANNCTQTINAVLVEPPALTLTASATPSAICLGDTSTLTATANGGSGTLNYVWSNLSTQSTQTVQPTTTTMYYVTVTDSHNCMLLDSVQVTVNVATPPDLGNDTAFCFGNQLTLNAGAGYASYQWQDGSTSQFLQVTQSNMYHVVITDANGCQASDTIFVTVHALPDPGAPASVEFCPGTSSTIAANSGFVSYLWNTGATSSSITITASGPYEVTVQDTNGCINTDTIIAIHHPLPILNFNVQPSSGCTPLEIKINNLTSLNGAVVDNWEWTVGGQTSFMFEPTYILTDTGLYDISLKVTTSNSCVIDTTVNNFIQVYPVPIAQATPSKIQYEQDDSQIIIYNESLSANAYKWFIADDLISQTEDLNYAIVDSGVYAFQLVALNTYGCTDTTEIIIKVLPGFALYFPNTFTPNEDRINDIFTPKGFGIKEYHLLIFNRWGQLVFETDLLNDGWDGTFKGLPAKSDIYVYKCNFSDFRNKKHEMIGHINLIR